MTRSTLGAWVAALREALGLPGLVIASLSLLMFVFGLMIVRRDFGRLERLRDELPRQLLGRWVRTASADYLSIRNLVDEAEAWRRSPAGLREGEIGARRAIDRLGAWFESQNTRAPLIDVLRVELSRDDSGSTLGWRARTGVDSQPLRQTRIDLLEPTETLPAVWLDVAYRPDPEMVTLGRDLEAAYRRLLVGVVGLSGYSLLCLGFMAFHAHTSRKQSARQAAREATLALADRTCHELGNVAFVLTNEGRNLNAHIQLVNRLCAELPGVVEAALDRSELDDPARRRVVRALSRELARRGLGLDAELPASTALASQAWRQIEACAGFIGLTVRELDTYLKQSTVPLQLEAIRLIDCVEEAILILKPALEASGVRLERSNPGQDPRAWGDRRLVLHALVNLIKNAVEAMRLTPEPTLWIHALRTPDQAILEIRDSGPGVPPELRDRLFQRDVSTKGPGRGQGLALASEALAAQGGSVRLVDTPVGACFRLTLPAAPEPAAAPEPEPDHRAWDCPGEAAR
ncbi:MAG: hypothetical protein KatS3mg108_1731 [Isosphaeraceae bacterium]|jgi:signal transduction histidine kinase|nr:MAG: hypothetical protein KatS3mg108_1731 [Isosphaeraceae bacterium]